VPSRIGRLQLNFPVCELREDSVGPTCRVASSIANCGTKLAESFSARIAFELMAFICVGHSSRSAPDGWDLIWRTGQRLRYMGELLGGQNQLSSAELCNSSACIPLPNRSARRLKNRTTNLMNSEPSIAPSAAKMAVVIASKILLSV